MVLKYGSQTQELRMVNKKTMKGLVLAISVCITQIISASSSDTLVRKALGLCGVCIAVSGLWKICRSRPTSGLSRIACGTVVAIGGICSDIIAQKIRSIIRRQHVNKNENQDLLSQCTNWIKGAADGAQDIIDGPIYGIGNAAMAQNFDIGLDNLKKGQITAGIDQIYDSIYHNIRLKARALLYRRQFKGVHP
jgi:hypothetical protein